MVPPSLDSPQKPGLNRVKGQWNFFSALVSNYIFNFMLTVKIFFIWFITLKAESTYFIIANLFANFFNNL